MPPVFGSGDILSSANLNIISENLEFFWGLVSGINIPFSGQTLSGSGNSRTWTFRHVARYLHYKIVLNGGTSDELYIRVNGNREYSDATNHGSVYTWQSYIDLNAITSPPTVGTFYDTYIEMAFAGGGGSDLQIIYLVESDAVSL